jgi:LysM repeat protein
MSTPKIKAKSPTKTSRKMVITVQPKETLFSISRRFGLTVDQIKAANGLTDNGLRVGQQLTIILPDRVVVSPTSPSTPSSGQGGMPSMPPPNPTPVTGGSVLLDNIFQVKSTPKVGFTEFTIQFQSAAGAALAGPMRNNYPSPLMVNPEGVMYKGKSAFEPVINDFSDVCQPAFYSRVLNYVSKNEGNFDAINSWDKAIFSYGFIQYTGAMASGAALSQLLWILKSQFPDDFRRLFGVYGFDVQENRPAPNVFLTTVDGLFLRNDDAYRHVAADLRLTGVFIAAAFSHAMQWAQVKVAMDNYVRPAMSNSAGIQFNGVFVPMNQILRSEAGFALRIDLAVNRGQNGALNSLKPAIEAVASQQGLFAPSQLFDIDEEAIVRELARRDGDTYRGKRVMKLLEAGFSFTK